MRALITGLAGFLGRHLALRLREAGWEVAGTVLDEPAELPGVTEFRADVLVPADLTAAVDAWRPDAIVHLAGLTHVGASWRQMPEYFRVNVEGTARVLDAAAGRRVLVASSAEIYGDVPAEEQPLVETRPPAPRSPYALTKAAAELLALRSGAVVARSFNIIGPGQATTFALPSFARQLASIDSGEQEPVLYVGNLEARRDFVHVADAVEAFRLLLERGEPGGIYNLGSGLAHSIEEVLARLIVASDVEARIEVDPERLRPVDIPLLLADPSRLQQLGWRPERTMEQAVEALWHAASDRAKA